MEASTNTTNWTQGNCQFQEAIAKFDAFLYIVIAVFTFCGGIIVFVCYTRHQTLRNCTNVFIISLSASDLLVAVLSIPYSFGVFLCQWNPPIDDSSGDDLMYLICDMIPSILSIYSLCLVALDRTLAICNPFFHTKHVNVKTASLIVLIMWVLVASFVAFIYILNRIQFTLFIIFMSFVIPVATMITCYTIIGYVARQHAKATSLIEGTTLRLEDDNSEKSNEKQAERSDASHATQTHCAESEARNNPEDGKIPLTIKAETKGTLFWLRRSLVRKISQVIQVSDRRDGLNLIKREYKAAITLSMLLTVFVLAWTPFIALNIHMYCCIECHIDFNLVKYFKILHYSNSALNPVLYVILNKRWRTAFTMLLCSFSRKHRRMNHSAMTEFANW